MTVRISETNSSPATRFEVEADLLSQSTSGNYSVVRCYLAAYNAGNNTSGYGGAGLQTGTIVGVKEFARRQVSTNFLPTGYGTGATRWRLGPYDVQVPHNPDGTRAALKFGMVLDYGAITETVFSADGALPLPTIPRATTAEIRVGSTPVTTLDVGTAATVYLPRASSSFTHTLELWEYGTGVKVDTITTGAGVSYAWTPALTLAQWFPDAVSKKFFLRTRTFNGASEVGNNDLVFTLIAPSSMVPTVSGITVTDDNPAVAGLIGGFVQGQSLLKAAVAAAGVQGSWISSAMVTLDGATAPSGGTLPASLSGSRVVAGAVTDSRGRTGTGTKTVTVLAYDLPKIKNFLVERSTSAGVPSNTGAYLRMTLDASVSSLLVGSEKNAATITVRTRARGTTAWSDRNVIPASLTYTGSVLITGGAVFAANTAWEIQVIVKDKLQQSTDFFVVSTAGAILDATGGKQAIGKLVEPGGPDTQIQGPARTYGDHEVDGALTQAGKAVVDVTRVATESVAGIAELATQAEVDGGDTSRIVTAGKLRAASWVPFAVAAGRMPGVNVAAGSVTKTAVTFPAGKFTVPPIVQVSQVGTDFRDVTCGAEDVTAAGMTVWRGSAYSPGIARNGVLVEWTAMQMTPGGAAG